MSLGFPIRVLVVEDDPELLRRLEDACTGAVDGKDSVRVATAADAAEARSQLEENEFDLIVQDLADGVELFRATCSDHPGVPVVVIADPDDPALISELVAAGHREDIFGTDEERPMVAFFHSGQQLEEALAEIRAFVVAVAQVASLAVEAEPPLDLTTSEARAIQIFVRRTGAATARVTPLSGGFSGAKTVIVNAADPSGMTTAHVVGKLAGVETIPSAVDGYENAIPDLPAGLGAALAGVVTAGAGATGATFYRLADDFRRTWFDCLASSPADAAAVIERLHSRFADRYATAPTEVRKLGSIRGGIFSNAEMLEAVAPIPDSGDLEETVEVEISRGIQHRDLHGLNVLVSDTNEPILIDYDNYRTANNALDPVTLELSAIFHRSEVAQGARADWPTREGAARWFELDAYLEGCPYPEAIRACRTWAEDAAASPRELAATMYSAAKRQFWFDNTDKDLAAALMAAGEAVLRG